LWNLDLGKLHQREKMKGLFQLEEGEHVIWQKTIENLFVSGIEKLKNPT